MSSPGARPSTPEARMANPWQHQRPAENFRHCPHASNTCATTTPLPTTQSRACNDRPRVPNEGKTPVLGDDQARELLDAPPADTLNGKRDRAILAIFLYHGLRCSELVSLCARDIEERRGVRMFKIHGKGSKILYSSAHPEALERIDDYLILAMQAMAAMKTLPSSSPRRTTRLESSTRRSVQMASTR